MKPLSIVFDTRNALVTAFTFATFTTASSGTDTIHRTSIDISVMPNLYYDTDK
jgi:hypothetical protein